MSEIIDNSKRIKEYSNLGASGFKLLELELVGHKILGSNKFKLVNIDDNIDALYFSVVIGSNGTGKSELLKVLLQILKSLNTFCQNQGKAPFDGGTFCLKYLNKGYLYTFSNFPSKTIEENSDKKMRRTKWPLYLSKNHKKLDSFDSNLILPDSIVANSIMLTDKFIVPRNENEKKEFSAYEYLGVRYRPQQASTRYYVRKTVEYIVKQYKSDLFMRGLKKAFDFLELPNSLSIVYNSTNISRIFNRGVSRKDFDQYFDEIEEKYKTTGKIPPFKVNNYKKISKEDGIIESLCEFITRTIEMNNFKTKKYSPVKIFHYNLLENESYGQLVEDYNYLDLLRQLGFVKVPEIKLNVDENFDLKEASSGEFHFFSTIVGLLATVKPNGLILIDEPEISLHANWQMKYLEFVRELFSDPIYKTCHIIIATHSHFLISDLKGESSNIIGLKKEGGIIKTVELPYDNTYGWSAEDVLYNVFNVCSTRNFYVAKEIGDILKEISKQEFTKKVTENKASRLKEIKHGLKDNDPLKSLINKIQKNILNA